MNFGDSVLREVLEMLLMHLAIHAAKNRAYRTAAAYIQMLTIHFILLFDL